MSRTSRNPAPQGARPRQLYIQCLKCNKNINNPVDPSVSRGSTSGGMMKNFVANKKFGFNNASPSGNSHQKHSCPHCGTPFPRCAICLLPLGTSNLPIVINGGTIEPSPDRGSTESLAESRRLKLNEWFSFCLSCNHGMHAGHAEEWFEKHYICPVPGCVCHCST